MVAGALRADKVLYADREVGKRQKLSMKKAEVSTIALPNRKHDQTHQQLPQAAWYGLRAH